MSLLMILGVGMLFFVAGALGAFFFEKVVLAWNYFVAQVLYFPQSYHDLKGENITLKQELEYSKRHAGALKVNIDSLMAKIKILEDTRKETLENTRKETVEQYQDWSNLKEERDKLKEKLVRTQITLGQYSKLLTDERIEGFQQAHQIGNLKAAVGRLEGLRDDMKLIIDEDQTKMEAQKKIIEALSKKKKSSPKFPSLYKRKS